jgi:hypothetical protein
MLVTLAGKEHKLDVRQVYHLEAMLLFNVMSVDHVSWRIVTQKYNLAIMTGTLSIPVSNPSSILLGCHPRRLIQQSDGIRYTNV